MRDHLHVQDTVITPAGECMLIALDESYGTVLDANKESHNIHVKSIIPKNLAIKVNGKIDLWDNLSLSDKMKVAKETHIPSGMVNLAWENIDKGTQSVILQRSGAMETKAPIIEMPQAKCNSCPDIIEPAVKAMPEIAFTKTEVNVCYCSKCGIVLDTLKAADAHEYVSKHTVMNKEVFDLSKKKKPEGSKLGNDLREIAVQVGNQAIGGHVLHQSPPKPKEPGLDTAEGVEGRRRQQRGAKPIKFGSHKPKKPKSGTNKPTKPKQGVNKPEKPNSPS